MPVLSVLLAMLAGCDGGSLFECERTLRIERPSPDGRFKAAIEDVQCGATTRDASWILLAKAHDAFDDERDQVATFDGRVRDLQWQGADLVVLHGSAKPVRVARSAGATTIVYRAD